jgi:hypothetical protein
MVGIPQVAGIPRFVRRLAASSYAARRKRAPSQLFSRTPAGQAPHPMAQPARSADGRAEGPAKPVGEVFQGFSGLSGSPACCLLTGRGRPHAGDECSGR